MSVWHISLFGMRETICEMQKLSSTTNVTTIPITTTTTSTFISIVIL